MDVFQRLNIERGITILLITHEHDIAEYGTRTIAFRDGHIVRDAVNDAPPVGQGRTGGPAAARSARQRHRHRPQGSRRPGPRGRAEGATMMRLFMIFRVALKALNRNKMRTALTMLGMIIGVAAVIAMVALGQGRHRRPSRRRSSRPAPTSST